MRVNRHGARATPVNTRARPSTPTTSDNAWLADANDEGQLDVVADREWNIAGPPRSNESRILERGPKGWKQGGGKTGPPAGGRWKFLLRVWFTLPPYYRSRGVIMTSRMRARDPSCGILYIDPRGVPSIPQIWRNLGGPWRTKGAAMASVCRAEIGEW